MVKDSTMVLLVTLFIVSIMTIFNGCTKPSEAKRAYLDCIDGHLYSIIPEKRYELIEKDGCTEGKITLWKKDGTT